MKNIQKLVLVPIERWEKIGDKIPVKEVVVKSAHLMNVSHQKNPISQVKKVKKVKLKNQHHMSQVKKVKNQHGLGKFRHMKQTPMFHFLTPEKRKKASKLFHYLMKYKIFSLNKDGEIIKHGKILYESNIVELINHAVDNVSSKPIGMIYFYQTLKKNNVPERYISNKIGKKIMNKSFLLQTSEWRPPGRLNRNVETKK